MKKGLAHLNRYAEAVTGIHEDVIEWIIHFPTSFNLDDCGKYLSSVLGTQLAVP